jgi:hypothetical protein
MVAEEGYRSVHTRGGESPTPKTKKGTPEIV